MADEQTPVEVPPVAEEVPPAAEAAEEVPAPTEEAVAPATEQPDVQPDAQPDAAEPEPAAAPAPAFDPIAAAREQAAALAEKFAAGHTGDDSGLKRKYEGDENGEGEPDSKRGLYEEHSGNPGNPGHSGIEGLLDHASEVFDCPSDKVGKVIGRAGQTIKDLQIKTMTRIQIDHKAPGDTKPITITGTRENVASALASIKEVLECETQAAPGDVTRSLECPAGIVGRIIGRGGETIRGLQQASGAHIMVDQNFPEGHPRVINLTGKADSVQRAYNMIQELIQGEPGSAQAVIQKFGLGVTRYLDCPKHMVGRVIGKSGETIKGLQKQYSVSIQIDQNSDPCKITITGPQASVQTAERAVVDIFEDRQPSQGPPGAAGYPGARPYGAAPYGGYGAAPYGAAAAYGGYPPAAGYGGYPGGYGGYPGYSAPPAAAAYGSYGGYGQAAAADPYQQQGGYGAASYGAQSAAGGASTASGQHGAASSGSSVWQELKDDQGRTYYYNSQTGVSQWERPADM